MHRLEENPLLEYTSRNWGNRIREEDGQDVQDLAVQFLLDDTKVSCTGQVLLNEVSPWHNIFVQQPPIRFRGVHYAAYFGLKGVMTKLLFNNLKVNADHKSEYGWTPLSWAAWRGNREVVRLLLEKAVDVDSTDNNGQTPLSLAAESGHEGVVKLLLDKTVDVDYKDNDGQTPLMLAAEYGHEGVAKLLLDKAADAHFKDYDGKHHCC